MVGNVSSNFADLVIIMERVEIRHIPREVTIKEFIQLPTSLPIKPQVLFPSHYTKRHLYLLPVKCHTDLHINPYQAIAHLYSKAHLLQKHKLHN
ncbi:hypothetical protein CR513_50065, partial [Mucuna pruriens]